MSLGTVWILLTDGNTFAKLYNVFLDFQILRLSAAKENRWGIHTVKKQTMALFITKNLFGDVLWLGGWCTYISMSTEALTIGHVTLAAVVTGTGSITVRAILSLITTCNSRTTHVETATDRWTRYKCFRPGYGWRDDVQLLLTSYPSVTGDVQTLEFKSLL